MKITLPLMLALVAGTPSLASATNALAPIQNAVPLYSGFKGAPLEVANRVFSEVSGKTSVHAKDFVTFNGYDEKLFSAFRKLPSKRTQLTDFTACAAEGEKPIFNRKITKGAVSALDYENDGFTSAERQHIESVESRILHYVSIPTEKDLPAAGVTQYLDFLKPSAKYPPTASEAVLRVGTLKRQVQPPVGISKCAKLDADTAIFPQEILRDAAVTGKPVRMEDKQGNSWVVRASAAPGRWSVAGPSHLTPKVALALFNKNVGTRAKNGAEPWHISQTETLKAKKRIQYVAFAKYDYRGGRSEAMTLVIDGSTARLGWTVEDLSPHLVEGVPPSVPPDTLKKSFAEYVGQMSARGAAAMRLMQFAFECRDSEAAKSLDSHEVSSWVLWETLGGARPTAKQIEAMSEEAFTQMVEVGVAALQEIDEVDLVTSVDCATPASKVKEWYSQLDSMNPEYVLFRARLGTMRDVEVE